MRAVLVLWAVLLATPSLYGAQATRSAAGTQSRSRVTRAQNRPSRAQQSVRCESVVRARLAPNTPHACVTMAPVRPLAPNAPRLIVLPAPLSALLPPWRTAVTDGRAPPRLKA